MSFQDDSPPALENPMKIIPSIPTMQRLSRKWKSAGKKIGFVPTMGALHQGHLELVKTSRRENDVTVVSIFVNPTQFGPQEDFKKYPRTLDQDCSLLRREKVQAVFSPSDHEMYAADPNIKIHITGSLVSGLCAPFRPGHFDGVALVVVKLLNIVMPTHLYLGQKDAQQVAVLKRTISELNLEVVPVVCPIVRERDGLAMSSRNKLLSMEGRRTAPALFKALMEGKRVARTGEKNPGNVLAEAKKVLSKEKKIKLQYLEAVDPSTLTPVSKIKKGTMLALAAYLDNVRLIDNIVI